jgi:4-carboxymuconolactone decarboxylase
MTLAGGFTGARLSELDDATRQLVRLAAVVAVGSESSVRAAIAASVSTVPHEWIEELLLQTYLFAGFPRALNAFREWRRLMPLGRPEAPGSDDADWSARGVATCQVVYGAMYEKLRRNIAALHPDLDSWMVVEGYGKVLSRPGLDLPRRELCIVAACVASGQERQLHSHLHGSLNVGTAPQVVRDALDAITPVVDVERIQAARQLFARVTGK